jgi:hypothetical protein
MAYRMGVSPVANGFGYARRRWEWAAVLVAALYAGCTAPDCPVGTVERNGNCIELEVDLGDGGPDGEAPTGTMENEQTGNGTRDGGTIGRPGVGGAGKGGSGARASGDGGGGGSSDMGSARSGTGGSSSTTAGTGGSDESAGTGGSGGKPGSMTGGTGGNTAGAGGSGPPPMVDPCDGQGGEAVCDKEVMLHCNANGTTGAQEACPNEMFCQIGLASGTCAVCNPGSFMCDDVNLIECNDAGQYGDGTPCVSAALCNAKAGACTMNACVPNTKVCADSGTLQTCNADGTKLTDREPCGANLCDAKNKRCYKCIPSAKRCDGTNLVSCSADGLIMQSSECPAGGECMMPSCSASSCKTMPKPAHMECTTGVCDGDGTCVGCVNGEDCDTNQVCTGGRCVNKVCTPNMTTCTSGGMLQTCSADGTMQMDGRNCGAGLCDAPNKTCYACKPNTDTCENGGAVHCDASGKQTTTACTAANECSTSSCSGGKCVPGKKGPGTACLNNTKKCDGNGNCSWDCNGNDCESGEVCNLTTHKCDATCQNGKVDTDLGEKCDPTAPEWKDSQGACSSTCQPNTLIYRECFTTGNPCWPGTNEYYCAPTGSCSKACSTGSDCEGAGAGATCLNMGPNHGRVCGVPCGGSSDNCPGLLTCQFIGGVGDFSSPYRMCGWMSVDLDNSIPWCPTASGFEADACVPPPV